MWVRTSSGETGLALARKWVSQRVVDPIILLLRRGADPQQLALSVSVGFALGLFPVVGVTTFLCAALNLVLQDRFNVPTMIIANLIAAPVELTLVVPFMRLGEAMTQSPRLSVVPRELLAELSKRPGGAMRAVANATLGWMVSAPLVAWLMFQAFKPVMHEARRRFMGGVEVEVHPRRDLESGGEERILGGGEQLQPGKAKVER